MPKYFRKKMTPRSARRVIKKYVRKIRGNFAQRVQKIVDRNLKNTPTNVVRNHDWICKQADNSLDKNWYVFLPGVDVFKRNMGAAGSQTVSYPMEGATCKIKKWWIKGSIQYQPDNLVSTTLGQSEVGYVDIYLMRYRNQSGIINGKLEHFYQSGTDTFTVKGQRAEMMLPINKNTYYIYTHRRFKMGAAWVRQDSVPAVSVNEQNNDFSFAKNFSFDVTKYVGKNRIVRYQDNEEVSQDSLLNCLCLVAIFHPACGDLGSPLAGLTGIVSTSAYSMDCSSWGEVETA